MTNTNGHGGARPKVRDDDARGKHHAPKPGSGRKPQSFTVKLGDVFAKHEKDSEGRGVLPGQTWTVSEITRTHVIFMTNDGDSIRLIR